MSKNRYIIHWIEFHHKGLVSHYNRRARWSRSTYLSYVSPHRLRAYGWRSLGYSQYKRVYNDAYIPEHRTDTYRNIQRMANKSERMRAKKELREEVLYSLEQETSGGEVSGVGTNPPLPFIPTSL